MTTKIGVAILLLANAVHAAELRIGQPVMGTILQVTVVAGDADAAKRAAEAAVDTARHWDDVLTTWRPEGELARLNDAAGSDVVVSPALRAALEKMLLLADRTNGAFDPAVGPLVAHWRLNRIGATPRRTAPIASSLRIGPTTVNLAKGVSLDAGAIGKGIALDAIADRLRKEGVTAAFADFGGSSQLAVGMNGHRQEWNVAVTGLATGVVHGTVALRHGALSTSRTPTATASEGAIIDPRTGRRVTERRTATVWHRDATDADAWSTALVVLGRDGIALARAAGVEVFFEDASGVIATPGFPIEPL